MGFANFKATSGTGLPSCLAVQPRAEDYPGPLCAPALDDVGGAMSGPGGRI